VSRLASVRVASMLFGDLRQFKEMQIQNLSHLSLVGEEKLNGRPTYRIKGLDWRQYELTIWVDKETFLLLKTYQIILPATNPSDETTTYKPEINKDIPARKLAFKH